MASNHPQETTHFGFESVSRDEKTRRVRGVFDSVASNYDLMNDVMSAGMHRLWKHQFVSGLGLRDGMKVLDLAGGTGDIAFRMQQLACADITVCDINHAMLVRGTQRAFDKGHTGLQWVCGNAESLPVESHSMDRVTIAFGIRNVTDIPAALREIHRVLKPGGQFCCLEFSHLSAPALQKFYDLYSFNLIPAFGKWVAKDEASYQYLVESIRQFPRQDVFKQMIEDAGFARVSYTNMTGGVVAMHKGWKI